MFSRKADAPFAVHVPAPAEDHPSWTRAGVIAVIGFLVGVAWPKLAGVRLGPSLPENATAVAAAPSASVAEIAPSASAAPAPAASSVPVVAAAPVAPASIPAALVVSRGSVYSCRASDGDALKGGDCGSLPGIDALVQPRLRKLSECADAAQVSGKVRFVVRVDFPRNAVSVDLGKNAGLPVADGILACAKENFTGATPPPGAHDKARYNLTYNVTFGSASEAASAAPTTSAAPSRAASETTQIVWDVAIVRDAPKTGKVVARLQRGTTIQIGQGKDGWFPVKFGEGFTGEGWLYRGAIGR